MRPPAALLLLLIYFADAYAMRHRIIWFCRNDLRLHDNPCLSRALSHKGDKEVLPVFLFDPRQFGTTRRGSPKTGAYRAKFLAESVADFHV